MDESNGPDQSLPRNDSRSDGRRAWRRPAACVAERARLWGVKFSLVLYCVGGWVGAYLYAGLWLRVLLQRRLAAALFVGNGFFFCRLGLGHFDFALFLMLPLMLWALHRCSAQKDLTIALLAAAVAMMIDGSPVTLLHLMSWVGLYAVVLSVCRRPRRWVPAGTSVSLSVNRKGPDGATRRSTVIVLPAAAEGFYQSDAL